MLNYQSLINQALQTGFSDIEIVENTSKSLQIYIYNGKVDKNNVSNLKTLSIRAIYNSKMSYLDIEDLEASEEYILKTLKDNASILQTKEEYEIFAGSKTYPVIEENSFDFSKVSTFDKINLLIDLEKQSKDADSRIVAVPYCAYTETESAMHIINSKGLDISKKIKYCMIMLQIMAKEDDDVKTGFDIAIKEKYDELDKELIVKTTVEKAISMLNAKPVESGVYPVILNNETMADMLEVYQSIFSAETAIKKVTPLLNKENEQIISSLITIVDDPLCKDSIVKEPFDDEGVACFKKNIVEDGKFVTFMHNLKTAKYFKTISTGNGFKAGSNIGISGVNLYIKPGNSTLEGLINGVDKGLLITGLDGLHAGVNPVSGDFSLKASGFYIEDGVIKRPVTLIVLAGNFLKMMNDVEKIGSDLKFGYGGVGAPSVLFKGLAISGN